MRHNIIHFVFERQLDVFANDPGFLGVDVVGDELIMMFSIHSRHQTSDVPVE